MTRRQKSARALKTISEVSQILSLPQHVLRFWETKFTKIRPLKMGGGRRYYRPEDLELLKKIQLLLHEDGYTIKGVQTLLKKNNVDNNSKKSPIEIPKKAKPNISDSKTQKLKEIIVDLNKIRDLLKTQLK